MPCLPFTVKFRGSTPDCSGKRNPNFCQRLQNYIPEDKLTEVKRVLYGANRGSPVQKLPLEQSVHEAAASVGYDVQGYKFKARQEQNRKPRIVKIGLIQNSIKAPTTAPYSEQTKVHMLSCNSTRSPYCSLRMKHL